MSKKTEKCHVCAHSAKLKDSEADWAVCPNCGADVQHPESETLNKKTSCNYSQSARGTGKLGVLHLTNKRLFWVQEGSGMGMAGGLLGMAVDAALKKRAVWNIIEIPLDSITGVEDTRQGLFNAGLLIHTNGGEQHRFFAQKLQKEWKPLLTP